jgi:hypothetical protein
MRMRMYAERIRAHAYECEHANMRTRCACAAYRVTYAVAHRAHAYEYVHANMRTRYACAAYGACAVCATAYDTRVGYLRIRGRRPAQQRQAPPKIRGALGVRGW